MIRIYLSPIVSRTEKTLQADGAAWEELALRLRDQDKTHLLGLLYDQLPLQFSRSEIIRITFQNKFASQLLEVAGLSG